MKFIFILLTLVLGMSSWASDKKEPIKTLSLTNNYQAHQFKDIFFGGQPTQEQLKEMRKQGFATIISLRDSSENEGYNEAKKAKSYGLSFVRVPVKGPEAMTPEKIDEITQTIVKNRSKGRVLVHCASGGRVGLWAGAHFFKDHKYSPEESQVIAAKIGMPEKFKNHLSEFTKIQSTKKTK